MRITNIGNIGRKVFLFIRHDNGELEIKEDSTLFPYYYSENPEGNFKSCNGKTLKKYFVSKPSDIRKQAGIGSWEADVNFSTRYMIDKIHTIDKAIVKYAFIDIEVICDEFPDPIKAMKKNLI